LLALPAVVLLATFTHVPAIRTIIDSFFATPARTGVAPIAFLVFQRAFIQSFLRAGIR
jgi:sn-glycerol 3-phosphate transport system permease protein